MEDCSPVEPLKKEKPWRVKRPKKPTGGLNRWTDPALRMQIDQENKQKEFKKRAGKRKPAMSVMQECLKKIEQCNRLVALIRYCKQKLRGDSLTYYVHDSELSSVCSNTIALNRDLRSLGLYSGDIVPLGRLLVLEQKIGAIKGGNGKKNNYHRKLSAEYSRWAAGRDPFGVGIETVQHRRNAVKG